MKTTLSLEKETLTNLNLMKYAMGLETLDDVITKLILSYKKVKVEEQVEEFLEHDN